LEDKTIVVTGGTGFLGTWIAECIAALNDERGLNISLELYARNVSGWKKSYPHLASRKDIHLIAQDIRSPFQFNPVANYVIHAAGIPSSRVHASDPLRVVQTIVDGIGNALEAATKLTNLIRFINISSCLVSGRPIKAGSMTENEIYAIQAGQLSNVYADAKRMAEGIATIYRNQYRLPLSTLRPFTFIGPYQKVDCPWAINNFLHDVLARKSIRISGNANARRSYLYGSDAAWWILVSLVRAIDGGVYNLGASFPLTHYDLASLISEKSAPSQKIIIDTQIQERHEEDDLFPNLDNTIRSLGISESCSIDRAIVSTLEWLSFDNNANKISNI
jgi:dTDP-glucose 4,6-dehydratase